MPLTYIYREWILANLKNSTDITYTELTPDHFAAVLELGNRVQGDGYLNLDNLTDYYQRGLKDGINAGIVAFYRDQLVGFRLTFAQGQWDIDQWATPAEWDVDPPGTLPERRVVSPPPKGRPIVDEPPQNHRPLLCKIDFSELSDRQLGPRLDLAIRRARPHAPSSSRPSNLDRSFWLGRNSSGRVIRNPTDD